MKPYRIIAGICALALVATVGAGVASAASADSTTEAAIESSIENTREARRAAQEAAQEKWDALTDAQKEEIYALKEEAADSEGKIADKYLEWGLIDEETATQMKERLTERVQDLREDGRMPMLGGRGGHGKGGQGRGGFRCAPTADGTTGETTGTTESDAL
ncbi:DUF2680 domain-containing protein [Anaerotalea alkaliphila]|uniref:DUF2680 domain-containing protein n=1 Tax=Anaerotalea alkaliphila TaxID=2662126 RepID=A0A7X5HXC8_9FIRM|nr:DUF2680 domain-containing protein [Anaerotalea alkaliphila]NDL68409.1 DUF2680 domain-containing protein [Anaerotalea alkaliphila]